MNRRGVPAKIKEVKHTKKGDMALTNNSEILILKWRDNRDVHMITTIHDGSMVQSGKRDIQTGAPILKPAPVVAYNKYTGGVDRSDQMLQYTAFKRKTIKWWKKAFFHLMDLLVLNAYILYKQDAQIRKNKPLSHKDFRRKLVHHLTSEVVARRPHSTPSVDNVRRLTERHFPSKVPVLGKKKHPTRVCVVCSSTNKRDHDGVQKRRESRYICATCDVGLCVTPCFQLYHTYKEYKLAHTRLNKPKQTKEKN